MGALMIAAVIGAVAAGNAMAEQRAQYQQVRPASINPRQVGIDTTHRGSPEIERAKCLKRKVKERRECLALVKSATPKAGS